MAEECHKCKSDQCCCPSIQIENNPTNTVNPTNTFNPSITINLPGGTGLGSEGIFTEFDQEVITTTAISIPQNEFVLLATVILSIDDLDDRIWLTGTVHTGVGASEPVPAFAQIGLFIFRNDPTFTDFPIFQIEDVVVNAGTGGNLNTTTFTFVDTTPPTTGIVTYFLTATIETRQPQVQEVVAQNVVFTGAEIEANI